MLFRSGKIDRGALPTPGTHEEPGEPIAPRTATESALVAIFCEVLAGWEGLTSSSGKTLDFDSLKHRLPDVIRDESLRSELVRAACAGATLSKDDAEGLHS